MFLTIYFVVIMRQGVLGVMQAGLIRSVGYVFVALIILIPDLSLVFSIEELKELLRFGLPLIPVSVAAIILSIGDRYFLQHFTSISTVGVYSMGYKIGGVLQLPVAAFQIAWPTVLFSVAKTRQAKDFYANLLTYFLSIMVLPVLGISIFAKEIVVLVTAPGYYDAWMVIPFVLLSHLILGTYYVTAVGVNLERRTEYLLFAWIAGVIVYLILNFILVPMYDMLGAAISTLFAYLVVMVVSTHFSLKLYHIPYQYMRLFKLIFILCVLYLVSLIMPSKVLIVQIVLKVLLTLSLPIIMWFSGFFTTTEMERFKHWISIFALRKNKSISNLY